MKSNMSDEIDIHETRDKSWP